MREKQKYWYSYYFLIQEQKSFVVSFLLFVVLTALVPEELKDDLTMFQNATRRRQCQPTPVLLPGKSHGLRSLVGYSPWGNEESDTTEWPLSQFTFMHWRRKWQPIPVFLPGESHGRGSLVGYHLWGHTESDTPEAT